MSMNYKFSKIDLTYATTNVNTETVYNTGTPQIITITAADGYYFDTPPYINTKMMLNSRYTNLVTDEVGDYKTSYYILVDEAFEKSASMYVTSSLGYCESRLYAVARPIPKVDKYGIISIYNPTPLQLKEIGEARYYTTEAVIDLGEYISSISKVFVKIPEATQTEVMLGGYKTNVICNLVEDDVVETDCGTVSIEGRYHNSMDYENTTVEIYLPLIGFKTLETEKVMNETLSLIYRTNVINGDSIACIYNTTGTLIYTFNCKASFEIPYKINSSENQGNVEVNSGYLFGFTPTVTIRYNKAYNASSTIGNDNQDTTLETLTGYVKCSEVFNTINATTTEKDEIDTLLKSGVIIT